MKEIADLIEQGNIEEVKYWIQKVGINKVDSFSRTALHWAAFYNKPEIIECLLSLGANINQADQIGYTPLHFAAQERHWEAARMLIHNGANLENKDIHGNTPLWTAIMNARDNKTVANLLITTGADLDCLNNYSRTPREMGKKFGFDV